MAKAKTPLSAVERRAEELDTIASVLPMERRDELAELLTDQDVETLKHLVNQCMGDDTLRALTSDLAYLEAWALAATGQSLPWPAPEALRLKFVAHHLWDPEKRAADTDHGMPVDVDDNLRRQGFLKSADLHASDTLRRRLASWSTLTKWRGLPGAFASPPLNPPFVWPCGPSEAAPSKARQGGDIRRASKNAGDLSNGELARSA